MKLTVIALMIAAFACSAIAQYGQWSSPVQITTGPDNDMHPAVANGYQWMWGGANAELLAFSRNGKNIGVIRTYATDTTWSQDINFVTNDSADNDFPSAFHTVGSQPSQEKAMLVWQGRRHGNLDILFSRYENLTWSIPQPIAETSDDDLYPRVYQLEGAYFVAWEQEGKILFAQDSANQWTTPRIISQAGDTLNHLPQIGTYYSSGNQPFVMWERKKDSDSTYAVMYSARNGTTWGAPDTLVYAGNNRRPRMFKYGYPGSISWEIQIGNEIQSFAGSISTAGGRLRIQDRSLLTYIPEYQRNASVNGFAVITTQPMSTWFFVAAWETGNTDSIGVGLGWGGNVKLSAGGNSTNTSPEVSQGNFIGSGGNVRVWVVWEARRIGRTKLYGSYAVLSTGDVDEGRSEPAGFILEQNYPNPFNPTTEIRYQTSVVGRVTLKVYDLLGREVATLVDEVQDSGFKSVTFNGSGFASGVYSYRLQAGNFVATKKLMLMR